MSKEDPVRRTDPVPTEPEREFQRKEDPDRTREIEEKKQKQT